MSDFRTTKQILGISKVSQATYNKRYEMVKGYDGNITLNDKPAQVVGFRCPFAVVRELDPMASNGHEWVWETVERVLANGGNFKA